MTAIICTVDVALLTLAESGLEVALLRRDRSPYAGTLALPGGYIHPEEDADAEAAAWRMLRSKTLIAAPYLEQLATFSGATRDPRGWSVSVAYYALVPFPVIAQSAHPLLQLTSVDRLPRLPFDHASIIADAVARLRAKSQYSSLPCFLAGDRFTLPQLQRVYEWLLGEPLNKVSFRRKMEEMDMLEPIEGELAADGAHRPAQVYRLKKKYREKLKLLERGL